MTKQEREQLKTYAVLRREHLVTEKAYATEINRLRKELERLVRERDQAVQMLATEQAKFGKLLKKIRSKGEK